MGSVGQMGNTFLPDKPFINNISIGMKAALKFFKQFFGIFPSTPFTIDVKQCILYRFVVLPVIALVRFAVFDRLMFVKAHSWWLNILCRNRKTNQPPGFLIFFLSLLP